MNQPDRSNHSGRKGRDVLTASGIALGVGLGAAFWLLLDNIALGIALGVVFAITFSQADRKKKS